MTAALAVVVAVLGVAALVLLAVTARPVRAPVPDLDTYYDRWSSLHGGFDPRTNVWTRGWLRGVHALARPLARRGVQPDALTAAGLWVSLVPLPLAAAGGRWPLLAVPVVVASGVLDNLDGGVAVLTDRATRFGAVLDSLVDRASDVAYLVALHLLGAPGELVVVAGALVLAQEYVRARAGQAGMDEVGVVTVAERPTRVILAAAALLGCGLVPEQADVLAAAGAATTAVFQVVGLGQVLVASRRALR